MACAETDIAVRFPPASARTLVGERGSRIGKRLAIANRRHSVVRINAAQYLRKRVDVNGKRMAIRGGSAGGYTTLCALVFHNVFTAGASYYGVADLEALAKDTHKFTEDQCSMNKMIEGNGPFHIRLL